MFQVMVVVSGSGDMLPFGVPVKSLAACTALVQALDWLWQQRIAFHTTLPPNVDWCPALAAYEGCDIVAVGSGVYEGEMYELNDDGQACSKLAWDRI